MTLCKSLCWLLTFLMHCFVFYLPHMMTTEEEGEALAGETWAGERMSLSAELPERSLPVQVPGPPPKKKIIFLIFFGGGWGPETGLTARRSSVRRRHARRRPRRRMTPRRRRRTPTKKEEDEEGMTLCKNLCWLLTFLMHCFVFYLPHMMTTEEEGEALAGETWAGERMSLSAELPERSLPVQVPRPPPKKIFFYFYFLFFIFWWGPGT